MTPDPFPEFSIVRGDPNAPTFASKLKDARETLHSIAQRMTADRSYDKARAAMNAAEEVGKLLDDGWLFDLPWDWVPTTDE